MAIEDFTTYTEVDPNLRLTVIANRITWTAITTIEYFLSILFAPQRGITFCPLLSLHALYQRPVKEAKDMAIVTA